MLQPKIIKGPGDILLKYMNYRGINIHKMAINLDVSIEFLESLLKNEAHITIEMANKLSKYFKNSRDFWINAEIQYNFNKILDS